MDFDAGSYQDQGCVIIPARRECIFKTTGFRLSPEWRCRRHSHPGKPVIAGGPSSAGPAPAAAVPGGQRRVALRGKQARTARILPCLRFRHIVIPAQAGIHS